jgi:hypothetical protein
MQIAPDHPIVLTGGAPKKSTSYAVAVNAGYSLIDSLRKVTGVYGRGLAVVTIAQKPGAHAEQITQRNRHSGFPS